MPRLDIYKNGHLLIQVKLEGPSAWIGRGGDCEVSLNDPQVSRHHVHVMLTEQGWETRNHGRNGTRLNESLLAGRALLQKGDRLYLGGHAIVFQAEEAPAFRADELVTAATDITPIRRCLD